VLLAITLVVGTFVKRDRYSWATSRSLSAALRNSRSVVLVEHSGGVEIARKTATPDEISRLQKAISVWPRPFAPETFLCWVPRHSIEIVRADGSEVSADVCFSCGKFAIEDLPFVAPLPPYLAKTLAPYFASVGMAPKTEEEYANIEISARNRQSKSPSN
jgi:hypothetical protein